MACEPGYVVTLPAENQQTVEALAETIARPLTLMVGVLNDEACADALAALRDLVAQAELAAEMGEVLRRLTWRPDALTDEINELLTRLDGAQREDDDGTR